jgi:ABC-2 type transport system ATP-binding protein
VTAAIAMRGLTKHYGDTLAVADVDLDIGAGAIFGLVGPNGAGKSTLIRMLATVLEPTAGEAQVCGLDIEREGRSVRRLVGYMPDTFGLYDDLRVWEYLDFFARIYGIPATRRKALVEDLLDLVDLAPKHDAYVQALSRGMQQRLCLAHALVNDPRVLLLDEPASGLDPRARVELRELIGELSQMGKTIVISSHILPELQDMCSAVAIMDRGQVMAAGSVDQIQLRFGQGMVMRARVLGGPEHWRAAQEFFLAQSEVAAVEVVPDGRLDLAFMGSDEVAAVVVYRAMSNGHRIGSFAPVVSGLEELFLQVTAPAGEAET